MAEYQLTHTDTVIRTSDGAFVPNDPANADRVEYDQWLADGGVPDPAEPLPEPPAPVPDPNARLDSGIDAAVAAWNGNTPARAGPPDGVGGLSVEERLIRLEETTKAKAEGQLPPGQPSPQFRE